MAHEPLMAGGAYALGPGKSVEPAPDPLLAWHAAARAEHLELTNVEWRDGELHAADWEAPGMLMSVRANLTQDRASAVVAKTYGDRFNAILSAMQERAADNYRRAPGYRWQYNKPPKYGTAADVKMRQQALERVNGMRFLAWGTLRDETTPAQWRKVQRTWRKHVLFDRVAFWTEADNSTIAGIAHNPLPPDKVGILSAIRWLPNAAPALLGMVTARLRLRLRGRVPGNLGGQSAANKPKPSYQWIFDDYQRLNKAAEYGRMYGAR